MATVVELAGEQRELVATVISDGFASYDDLEDFAANRIGLRLNNVTVASAGMVTAARAAIKWAQSEGALAQLLAMLAQKFPDFAPLQALVAEVGIDVVAFAAKELPRLPGLNDAARDPATRKAFAPYRFDIENLCRLAIEVRDWKYLHDKVDAIRNNVYNPLLAVRPMLAMAGPIVKSLQPNLDRDGGDIAAKVDSMALAEDDRTWIDVRLLPARDLLQTAVGHWPAEAEYTYIMELLSIVTSSDLSGLNTMIKSTAASITALKINEKLALLKADVTAIIGEGGRASDVASDIANVEAAVATLLDRNTIHNRWQRIKDELEPLGTAPDRASMRARMSWQIIDPLLGKCEDRPPDVDPLRARITAIFADPQATDLAEAIGKLDGIVAQQFYAVDKNLLDAAEALGQIGGGLKKVLDILDTPDA